jgi:hypothetical protein
MGNEVFWNTFLGQICIELIGGTIGALIFLFIVLLFFRPKLKVSNFICVNQPDGMQNTYYFKIVNYSKFAAHDINIELFSSRKIPMGGGKFNPKFDKLNLVLSHFTYSTSPFHVAENKRQSSLFSNKMS